jgi:hypothetical protein
MNADAAASRVRAQPGRALGGLIARADVWATLLVCLPIAVNAVRAAASDWVPIGDDAFFTLRSMDVATSHHPLLGAWSSGSVGVDRSVNNLGPIQLDLLAPFTRIAPDGGTAIAVAVVNIAAIVTAAWLLGRLGGRRATLLGMLPIALMTWTMGSEMLITPRQHQFLVLSYLCFLIAAWAAAGGDRWALVPAVAAASLCTQTHLSYPILVATVGTVAIVGQALAWRRSHDRRAWRVPWGVALGLALVLWSQTIVDQLFGWGNFTDVVASPGSGEQPGWGKAAQIVGGTLLHPRTYVRRGWAEFDPEPLQSSIAAVLVVGLTLVLTAAAVWASRRGRMTTAAGLAVAAAAVAAAIVDASQLPITVFGLTPFNYRWIWPTGTFLLIGSVVAIGRVDRVAGVLDDRRATWATVGAVGVLSVANLPVSLQVPDPARYADDQRGVAELVAQLGSVPLDGPVVIDQTNMYFGHSYGYPTAVALRRRGIDYRFIEPMQERRFGGDRVADGAERTVLTLWAADDAVARFDDPATVVYVASDPPIAITLEQR